MSLLRIGFISFFFTIPYSIGGWAGYGGCIIVIWMVIRELYRYFSRLNKQVENILEISENAIYLKTGVRENSIMIREVKEIVVSSGGDIEIFMIVTNAGKKILIPRHCYDTRNEVVAALRKLLANKVRLI